MSALPNFLSSCIAPTSDGQNALLFGVPSPGTLEAHLINLSDPLNPTSTLVSTTTSNGTVGWDTSSSLGCYAYLGHSSPTTPPPPLTIIQFGNTLQTQFYPNGTWVPFESTTETSLDYITPKLFSLVGSTDGWNWFVTRAAGQPKAWRHLRIGNRTETGSKDLTIAGSEPLLTVGAIAPDVSNFGNGLLFYIDQSGSTGSVYRATRNKSPALNMTATNDTLVTLSKASPLNMNSNTLTVDAVPVTSAFAAFILDKNAQGIISVYSIDPRIPTFTLARTAVKGPSPLFQPTQSFTSLNSRIVVYGGAVPNAIHIFDVISGTWTGPALVDSSAANDGSATSKGLSMGVIGGIAAAVVVLILVGGTVLWRIRRRRYTKGAVAIQPNNESKDPPKERAIDLFTLENKDKPGLDDRKKTLESSADLAPRTPAPSMPGTPVSQYRKSYSNHRRPGGVSRHASTYSMRSNGSTSQVSLFPTVYLAGPATVIPPTPPVPLGYTTASLQQLQNAAAVYRSTSAPGTPIPRSAEPPSRKGSMYKVSVPNEYDDRQPLHHHESSEEQQSYLQLSAMSTSSGSPASLSGSRPLEPASSTALGNGHSQSRGDTSGYHRSSFSSMSQPTSPRLPRPPTSTLDGESPYQTSLSVRPSRPRKKRVEGASSVSPTSPTSPSESSQRHHSPRDSETYKVEYRDTSSHHQQQQQQQQRQHGGSSTQASPTTPYATASSSRLAPSTGKATAHSSSPTPSETDTHFADAFPMPPKMAAPKSSMRQGLPSSSASLTPSQPTPSRNAGQQQQQQQQRQEVQYKQQQQLSGQEVEEAVAGQAAMMSPKTPKLVSLPRPIPRERERERERERIN